ncbi:MAG TPA: DUF167 domain-containing protein [Cytophagaceae bacterium]|jgi:uncharacterized protein (TIGR00251 family)|nr:DUF167 domain-containing protein [Cytophagaceae bacterium]
MTLYIVVKPNSKTDSIGYDEQGNLKVKIKAPPVDGKANQYLIKYLAEVFEVSKSNVEIMKGSNNQHKKVEISGDDVRLWAILEKI